MAINLLETVQKNLGYAPLKKIDVNTQQVKGETDTQREHSFEQAAIPAVLAGLYTFSAKDDAADKILRGQSSSSWVTEIFGEKVDEMIQKIAAYSGVNNTDVQNNMNAIANEAIKVTRESLPENATIMHVKDFLSNQTNNFLKFMPHELQIGKVVNEDALDDDTNKMEGPISSLMHKIGSAFSNPSNEEEVNTKP